MLVFVANNRFFGVQNLFMVCFSWRASRSYNGSELQYEQVHRIALLPCREICWTFRNLEICSKRASGQPLFPAPPSAGSRTDDSEEDCKRERLSQVLVDLLQEM
jgi:hypothetical protein